MCFFGGFFGFDGLPPIAGLLSKQLHFSDSNIGLIQAAYSFPTIVTLVIGGIITDRMIGWANDHSGASAVNPGGYLLGMKIFSTLGLLSALLALLLRRREAGPAGCGLETITTAAQA